MSNHVQAPVADREPSALSTIDHQVWSRGRYVRQYARRNLLPAEALALSRYSGAISGRTLEIGCGAGRLLWYLAALSKQAHGIDLAERMVAYCRATVPSAQVQVGDMGQLSSLFSDPFDAVLAVDCVLDVYGDEERRTVLRDIASLVAPGGVLIFSSHNLGHPDGGRVPRQRRTLRQRLTEGGSRFARLTPAIAVTVLLDHTIGWRNRRRVRRHVQQAEDYAIVNDSAHHFSLLHYYIGRDAQVQQLLDCGFQTLEVMDGEGRPVLEGERGATPWLFYVATPSIDALAG